MICRLVSHSVSDPEHALAKSEFWMSSSQLPFATSERLTISFFLCSLSWLEMRTVLAKLVWKFDFKLGKEGIDWHRDAKMVAFWNIPELWVKVTARG